MSISGKIKKAKNRCLQPLFYYEYILFPSVVFFLGLLVQLGINPLIPPSVSDLVYPLSYAGLLNNNKNKTTTNPDFGIIKASMLGFPLASRSSPSGTSLSVPLHFSARQISIIRTLLGKKKKIGTATLSSSTWLLISSRNNPS